MKTRSRRPRAWRSEIEDARQTLDRLRTGVVAMSELDRAAPLLMDSAFAAELYAVLDRLPLQVLETHPGLGLARARQFLLAGDRERARVSLASASACAGDKASLLARIYWELGCISLQDDGVSAAVALDLGREAVGEGADGSPDLLHLSALIAERASDRTAYVRDYRRAIATGERALTLLTRVLALRNLASALAHSEPRSAAGLCALALALIDGDCLDPRVRPSVENVLGYTLLCSGQLEEAQRHTENAKEEARARGHSLIEAYATFNLAIAAELLGEVDRAEQLLADLAVLTDARSLPELPDWIRIRRAWLALRSGVPDAALQIGRLNDIAHTQLFGPAVATLQAILDYRSGRYATALGDLQHLIERYATDEDWLSAFVLLLWVACIHERGGDRANAGAAVKAAIDIGQVRNFTVATNWWCDELVEIATLRIDATGSQFCRSLRRVGSAIGQADTLRLVALPSGDLTINGEPLPSAEWRMGRSGSRVLRRLFAALVSAHPVGLERVDLADMLWPESDGDRAIRNLDSALNDLRVLLRRVGGIAVATTGSHYRLELSAGVALTRGT